MGIGPLLDETFLNATSREGLSIHRRNIRDMMNIDEEFDTYVTVERYNDLCSNK